MARTAKSGIGSVRNGATATATPPSAVNAVVDHFNDKFSLARDLVRRQMTSIMAWMLLACIPAFLGYAALVSGMGALAWMVAIAISIASLYALYRPVAAAFYTASRMPMLVKAVATVGFGVLLGCVTVPAVNASAVMAPWIVLVTATLFLLVVVTISGLIVKTEIAIVQARQGK